ncbi:hypothetical protein NIES4106_57620 (plasmid) [Fischerella sp. NIES-4106]|nr:hypothetical protein NIES4106_57620 [Fischerella sp. NIES-4106]
MPFTHLLNGLHRLAPEVRLMLSAAFAGAISWLLPASLGGEVRVLVAWIVGVFCFLTLMGVVILRSTSTETLRQARRREPNALGVLVLVIFTTCSSIFIIGLMLTDSKTTPQPLLAIQIWLSLAAVLCSWLLTHLMFGLQYARMYYNEVEDANIEAYAGGLAFPSDEPPDYLDFMYFAFTISMTSQTSDVSITTRGVRRLVLLHELVSFFFYSVIIASIVNTVASLI